MVVIFFEIISHNFHGIFDKNADPIFNKNLSAKKAKLIVFTITILTWALSGKTNYK